jgi:proteasome accessory factor B
MLLNLAGRAWNQNSMSSDAARGLFKLRALADVKGSSELIGLAPRIRTHHPTFAAIKQACAENEVIEFHYRKPQDSVSEKRVLQPWKLSNIDGQWLVTGWDEIRGEVRNFLLQRIIPAQVSTTKRHFEAPAEADLASAKQSLDDFISTQVAVLRVKPATRAWLHFGMDRESTTGSTQKQINFMDLYLLAAQLRHFGSDIEVISPEALKAEIRKGFEKVASLHHG